MKKDSLLILPIVFVLSLHGISQTAISTQKSMKITGAELLKMLRSSSGAENDRASSIIGEIFGPKLNNRIIPDSETLYGLGRILMNYMTDHPASQGLSAEQLVMEVLKNAPAQIEKTKAFWANAYQAAEVYFIQPSPENAKMFFMAMPDRRLPSLDFRGYVRLGDFIFGSNFAILEKNMVEVGEPYAVDIGFRLINISDAHSAEVLINTLGEILPKHPRLFLQKLLANEGKTQPTVFERLNDIVIPGIDWEGMPEDEKDQLKYRELMNAKLAASIKALESVDDPSLREIRDKCLAILKGITSRSLFGHKS